MPATMQDWKDELKGISLNDESEYETFIPRDGDDAFLQEAFAELPNGQEFITRIKTLLLENDNEGWYVVPHRKNYLPEADLKKILLSYQHQISPFLQSIGEENIASAALQSKTQTVYSNDEFYSIIQNRGGINSEVEWTINDTFTDYFDNIGEYIYALDEAVLFLTKYPAITRYILEPVVGFPSIHRPYYDLWKAGGDCYFYQDRILLLCEYGS